MIYAGINGRIIAVNVVRLMDIRLMIVTNTVPTAAQRWTGRITEKRKKRGKRPAIRIIFLKGSHPSL